MGSHIGVWPLLDLPTKNLSPSKLMSFFLWIFWLLVRKQSKYLQSLSNIEQYLARECATTIDT